MLGEQLVEELGPDAGTMLQGCKKMLMLQSFRPSNKLLYLKLGDWILKVIMRKQAELKYKVGEEIQAG